MHKRQSTTNADDLPQKPSIPDVLADASELVATGFRDDERYEALDIAAARMEGQNAVGVLVTACRIRGTRLAEGVLERLELVDVRLEDCDLANALLESASFERVEITGSRMVGSAAPESRLRDVLFRDCNLPFAQFRYAVFRHVRFEGCDLRSAEFNGADMRGVVFDNCDLSSAVFVGARLDGADVSTSEITGLSVGLDSLKGLIVAPHQAVQLASLSGLRVR